MKEIWTSMASIMGVMAFFQTLLTALFPPTLQLSLLTFFSRLFSSFSSFSYFDITEIDGVNTNELYNAVQSYLSSTAISATRLSLSRSLNSSSLTFSLSHNDTLYDSFHGVSVRWEHVVLHRPPVQSFSWRPLPDEKRAFILRMSKMHSTSFLRAYLDHIMAQAAEIRRRSVDRYLYTNSRAGGGLDPSRPGSPWEAVPFKHPSTFDTLAMDPDRKMELMSDLKDFVEGESFYRSTGRAWKRGYLLYGPPGTGKSSMIAAMANYLGYDVYDLELTEVGSNAELRKLLMKTTPKSIIVIEDIDCSLNLSGDRKSSSVKMGTAGSGQDGLEGGGSTVTLSGLLGFTDGLWSCCGSERIFVLTTNHVEKIDPALMRSGRMDMHIHMGYCSYEGLKILLKNYVGVDEMEGGMKEEFEKVIEDAKMTPADVSEVLIRNRRRKKEVAMDELLVEMRKRVVKNERKMVRFEEEEEQEKRELETHHGSGGRRGGGDDERVEDMVVGFDKDSDEDGMKKFD